MDRDKAFKIIERLYTGIALRRALEGSPREMRLFFDLVEKDVELLRKYSAAQQARAEILADEIVDIADTEPDPNRARVMVEARKWYASKMQPNKYGDRIDLNVSGAIDITAAIDAARSRVMLPMSDPKIIDATYVPVTKQQLTHSSKGHEPVTEKNRGGSDELSDDDIFS